MADCNADCGWRVEIILDLQMFNPRTTICFLLPATSGLQSILRKLPFDSFNELRHAVASLDRLVISEGQFRQVTQSDTRTYLLTNIAGRVLQRPQCLSL